MLQTQITFDCAEAAASSGANGTAGKHSETRGSAVRPSCSFAWRTKNSEGCVSWRWRERFPTNVTGEALQFRWHSTSFTQNKSSQRNTDQKASASTANKSPQMCEFFGENCFRNDG